MLDLMSENHVVKEPSHAIHFSGTLASYSS